MATWQVEYEIRMLFPDAKNFEVTSDRTIKYNCIAWAAEENDRFWWPDRAKQYYWPKNIPREETVDAFVAAFSARGYSVCSGPELEEGFLKIALYVNALGRPSHAARQLPDGRWTSKLGSEWDISHDLSDLAGFKAKSYGNITTYMKRPTA